MKSKFLVYTIAALSLSACGPSREQIAKDQGAEITMTGELTNSDYEKVAKQLIEDALSNEVGDVNSNKQHFLAIGSIKNNTMQRISPNEIASKLKRALMRSGKNIHVTNLSEAGAEGRKAQDASMSQFVNHDTVVNVKAVDYSMILSGSISQKDVKFGNNYLVEYVFNFVLNDKHTMLTIWEGDISLKKVISKDMVNW